MRGKGENNIFIVSPKTFQNAMNKKVKIQWLGFWW